MVLSDYDSNHVKSLRKDFRPYADKGWMSEGSDAHPEACGVCFNNDTDEMFYYSFNGGVISPRLSETPLKEASMMTVILAKIARIVWR